MWLIYLSYGTTTTKDWKTEPATTKYQIDNGKGEQQQPTILRCSTYKELWQNRNHKTLYHRV